MLLNAELIEPVDPRAATRAVVFLHGILGSGANLRSFARRLVAAAPAWRAAVMDLRAHGRSLGSDGLPDTVQSAAHDVLETAAAWSVPLEAVVGHSFGGKVALEVARTSPAVRQVMTWDSAPGAGRSSEGTAEVLERLRGPLGAPFESRDAFVEAARASGLGNTVARWLAMNVELEGPGRHRFKLDLGRVDALLASYLASDLWPVVEAGPADVHLVIGARSPVYGPAERARAAAAAQARAGHVTVDEVPAGHWVHVEAAQAVASALVTRLGAAAAPR